MYEFSTQKEWVSREGMGIKYLFTCCVRHRERKGKHPFVCVEFGTEKEWVSRDARGKHLFVCIEFGTENERVSTSLCAFSLVQRMKG